MSTGRELVWTPAGSLGALPQEMQDKVRAQQAAIWRGLHGNNKNFTVQWQCGVCSNCSNSPPAYVSQYGVIACAFGIQRLR
ncbi:hypothetical protein OAM67_01280 [bacterium]|nr:hypothetical protein [bacterium]